MRGQLPIGSVLAGYRIIELIGDGAGGAVYLAEQEERGERVALKVLADELAHDDRFRRRFLRESTIAAGLRHPHVVPILDFGEADGGVYLAMRHIDGADLRELLGRDGRLDFVENHSDLDAARIAFASYAANSVWAVERPELA